MKYFILGGRNEAAYLLVRHTHLMDCKGGLLRIGPSLARLGLARAQLDWAWKYRKALGPKSKKGVMPKACLESPGTKPYPTEKLSQEVAGKHATGKYYPTPEWLTKSHK